MHQFNKAKQNSRKKWTKQNQKSTCHLKYLQNDVAEAHETKQSKPKKYLCVAFYSMGQFLGNGQDQWLNQLHT